MSEKKNSALIFPAFAHEYPADPFGSIRNFKDIFYLLLDESARIVDPDLADLNFITNNFLDHEIRTQYVTFIYSCSLSEYLKSKGFSSSYTAGYSMGIYSSLYHSGVTTFSDGLLLIQSAYHAIKKVTAGRKSGMCSIIGLSRTDISGLIEDNGLEVGITNQNSPYAFVLSGTLRDILRMTDLANAEGALHTTLFKVNLPYHSTILDGTQEIFSEFIRSVKFQHPSVKIISLIDQRVMSDPEDLKKEVVSNLFTPLNWYKTQSELQNLGVDVLIEGGFGNGLVKNSKFIEGNYRFYTVLDYLQNI